MSWMAETCINLKAEHYHGTIYGEVPVQGEGQVLDKEWYYHARGNRWYVTIGNRAFDGEWRKEEAYGTTPYAAGWMSLEEARTFIIQALNEYLDREMWKVYDGVGGPLLGRFPTENDAAEYIDTLDKEKVYAGHYSLDPPNKEGEH